MNILQTQPILSISTNQCKKQFLINQISQMSIRKNIYLDILDQLKSLLKETSSILQNKRQKQENNQLASQETGQIQYDIQKTKQATVESIIGSNNDCNAVKIKQIKSSAHSVSKMSKQVRQFSLNIQNKVNDYCCQQISQNIVKYLEIQKQQNYFYPSVINSLKDYTKSHQKYITYRQKQLQDIQDQKCQQQGDKQNIYKDTNKKCSNKGKKQVFDKKSTQKTICSFDFNKKVLQVMKRQLTFMKLKKRKLQILINQKKLFKQQQQKMKLTQKPSNFTQIKRSRNINLLNQSKQCVSEQIHLKKLPSLKKNLFQPLKSQRNHQSPHQVTNLKIKQPSSFQKIVMIYQKDKFINDIMQQKIQKIRKKLSSKNKQNQLLKLKTVQLERQIQKLDWNNMCNSNNDSFIFVKNKKINQNLDLSLLERTYLKPCDQNSVEYSQMSINQSIIKNL